MSETEKDGSSDGFVTWLSRKRLELACGSVHCPSCEREGLENFFAFAAGQHGLDIDVGPLVDEYLASVHVPVTVDSNPRPQIPDFVDETVDFVLSGSWRFVEGFQAFCKCRTQLSQAA